MTFSAISTINAVSTNGQKETLTQHNSPTQVSYCGHQVTVLEKDKAGPHLHVCHVIPPHLTKLFAEKKKANESILARQNAQKHDTFTNHVRHDRAVGQHPMLFSAHPQQLAQTAEPEISIYTANNQDDLKGTFVLSNQKAGKGDDTETKALKAAQNVFAFWSGAYNRNSYDAHGAPIKSIVHYQQGYDNAFWLQEMLEMVYGDGDGTFVNFTELSVVGHELGHAVTGPKLNYQGESGALNESLSDVWGSLVLQYVQKQTVDQASWLIGEGVLQYQGKGYPLRSMKAPGTAYDIPDLGKDPQPDNYANLYTGTDDNGGVHINSGISNRAFYLFAMAQGGYAWEKAGKVWYSTINTPGLIQPDDQMIDFAHKTIQAAQGLFPNDAKLQSDLLTAWQTVGVLNADSSPNTNANNNNNAHPVPSKDTTNPSDDTDSDDGDTTDDITATKKDVSYEFTQKLNLGSLLSSSIEFTKK